MALEKTQPQEVDLDRTDRLPIVGGTTVDEDVADDAVRLDYSPAAPSVKSEFPRAAGADRPARTDPALGADQLARTDSALGTDQFSRTDQLSRTDQFSRTDQLPRTDTPSYADQAARAARVRSVEGRNAHDNAEPDALERAYDRARGAEAAAVAHAQAPAADFAGLRALLESEQARSRELENETRTLRGTLAARDAGIVHVQHSLAERDAQLHALQREHAQVVPALEERSRLSTQLEAELRALRKRHESMAADLQQSVAALTSQLKAGKKDLDSTRRELNVAKLQAVTYLEHLRTREWRRGFDQMGTQTESAALQTECDQLRARVGELDGKLAMRDEAIAKLKTSVIEDGAQRGTEHPSATDKERAALSAEVHRLQSEARTWEDEKTVLLAHLQEARRLIEPTQADMKRLTVELAAKTRALERLNEDSHLLRADLARARSSLEERDILIRRLEHSETNGAHVSGPDGNVGVHAGNGAMEAAPAECTAELIRIDGQHNTAHPLSRRTRIGRAPGCEMQVDSTSVSRHHALVHLTAREVIIEDLNSTNGVLVNGRRISRQLLNDGDLLTIGDTQFRLRLKLPPQGSEAPAPT